MPPHRLLSLSLSLLLLQLVLPQLSSSCFITNCPAGGKKRAALQALVRQKHRFKQCPPCGPQVSSSSLSGSGPGSGPGSGRCFGPSLCCVPDLGCFVGSPDRPFPECAAEDDSLVPCRNDVASCKSVSRGQCVLRHLCCNERGNCAEDPECEDTGADHRVGRMGASSTAATIAKDGGGSGGGGGGSGISRRLLLRGRGNNGGGDRHHRLRRGRYRRNHSE